MLLKLPPMTVWPACFRAEAMYAKPDGKSERDRKEGYSRAYLYTGGRSKTFNEVLLFCKLYHTVTCKSIGLLRNFRERADFFYSVNAVGLIMNINEHQVGIIFKGQRNNWPLPRRVYRTYGRPAA